MRPVADLGFFNGSGRVLQRHEDRGAVSVKGGWMWGGGFSLPSRKRSWQMCPFPESFWIWCFEMAYSRAFWRVIARSKTRFVDVHHI